MARTEPGTVGKSVVKERFQEPEVYWTLPWPEPSTPVPSSEKLRMTPPEPLYNVITTEPGTTLPWRSLPESEVWPAVKLPCVSLATVIVLVTPGIDGVVVKSVTSRPPVAPR